MLLLMSSRTYSQQTTLNSKGDTTICFSVKQSKYLLKKVYEAQYLDSVVKVFQMQRLYLDSIILKHKAIESNYKEIIVNNSEVVIIKDYQIKGLNDVIKSQKKEISRQKTYKWFAIIAGGVVSGFIGYKYITK